MPYFIIVVVHLLMTTLVYIVSTQVPYPWPYLIADVPKEVEDKVETRAVLPVDSSVCGRGVRFESNRMNIVNKQVIFIP